MDDVSKAEECVDALVRKNEALREVLKRVEWCGTIEATAGEMRACCPICEAPQEGRRHEPDCALAAALTQADGGRDGD